MENIILPTITDASAREEVMNAINLFNSNQDYLEGLISKNLKNYCEFVDNNRALIKKVTAQRGKVYKILNKSPWEKSCYSDEIVMKIMYAYVSFAAIRKDDNYYNLSPKVKVIPLDENGKTLKYLSIFVGKTEMLDVRETDSVPCTHLSEEDYPNILLLYKNHLKKTDKTQKDLALYQKLKMKFGD